MIAVQDIPDLRLQTPDLDAMKPIPLPGGASLRKKGYGQENLVL
jgi:hypothetical protein